MAVTLTIKNVSEAVAGAIKVRARKNHRSIQGEMKAILEEAVLGAGSSGARIGKQPFSSVFGILHQEGMRALTVEEMDEAIAEHHRESR